MTIQEQARDALVERLFGAALGAFDLMGVYLGDRLGLYTAMAGAGPLTAAELSARAGIAEHYAREWSSSRRWAGSSRCKMRRRATPTAGMSCRRGTSRR